MLRRLGGLAGLLILALAGWFYRDSLSLQAALQSALPDKGTAGAAVRKCLAAGKVLYTNGACPSGAVDAPVNGGAVTVVEGQSVAARMAAAAPAASIPTARGLLLGPEAARIKDKRMEEIIGK